MVRSDRQNLRGTSSGAAYLDNFYYRSTTTD
jgi:hypothetical protein